ncbi:MAG: tetratricopeptide repeat protein [Bacteroides sp.]|nr:tetratricopeptide repeat protein [Bacteroides sp.]
MTRLILLIILWGNISVAAVMAQSAADSSGYMNLTARADSLMKEGMWREAADSYMEAMRSEPGNGLNPLLMCNLGMCLNEAGDVNGAIIALTDARRMMPRSVTAALNRAQVFRSAGLDAEAYADLSDALRLDSTLVEPRLIHGMMALRADSIDVAREDFFILSSQQGDDAHLAAATGNAMLYMAIGSYSQAIPPLSTLIEKYPSDVDWLSRRALCRMLSGDPAGASEDLAEAMRIAPQNGELYLYRAMLGKLRFRGEESKYDARHAITLGIDPDHVEAMLKLVE